MFHHRRAIHRAFLAAMLGLGVSFAIAQTSASSSAMTTRLSGESEVPPVVTGGRGSFEANLNRQANVLNWTLTYSGLSGPVTAAHFHGPAMPGENAGVALPLSGSLASPMSGTVSLTPAQAADLIAGKWYVNLHTAANPNGEIRGQLTVPR